MHGRPPELSKYKKHPLEASTMGKVKPEGEMPPTSSPLDVSQGGTMNYLATQSFMSEASPELLGPNDPKRKKGNGVEGKSIEEELCRICGDRASGYHYNALSCEGCKGFFRRSITKGANYNCKFGDQCEMDMWMRRKCQACRLRRCREVGMKEECLLSDDQCKARDARRKNKRVKEVKKEVHSPQSIPNSTIQDIADFSDIKPPMSDPSESSYSFSPQSLPDAMEDVMDRLEDRQRIAIQRLCYLQDKYEFADQECYEKALEEFNSSRIVNGLIDGKTMLSTLASTFIIITKLVVTFALDLTYFREVHQDDQITLLKCATTEVLSIRAARCYDLNNRCIIFANGQPCSLQNFKAAHADMGNYCDMLFDFCHNLAEWKTDNAEYALLTAICIFSGRPDLVDDQKVENFQAYYVDILDKYCRAKRGNAKGSMALARFLNKSLSDLRTISSEHSKLLVELDTSDTGISELEIIRTIVLEPEDAKKQEQKALEKAALEKAIEARRRQLSQERAGDFDAAGSMDGASSMDGAGSISGASQDGQSPHYSQDYMQHQNRQ